MHVELDLTGNIGFNVTTGSGHQFITDAGEDFHGENQGARPMELLLAGVGGCSGIDVLHILRKGKAMVTDLKVTIDAERADTDPKVFTNITINFALIGEGLDKQKVERAIHLSAEKYCSASIMIGRSAVIEHRFTINGE